MPENNSKKKILIVEDDMGLQKILREKLEQLGLAVTSADNGQGALNSVKESVPDLILLDIMLPGGMNGFDVMEQLKKHEVYKSIPVIVLTNLDTEQKTALDIGAIDYIVKPNTSIDDVVLKIKNHIQEK